MKLDNVEVTHEEVNEALSSEIKEEKPYDSREYIYEDEYNQQSANNNYTNENGNREVSWKLNCENFSYRTKLKTN